MPENLPTHTHCLECDYAMPEGRPYCSEECERAHEAKRTKERNRNLLFMVAAIAAVLLIAFLSMGLV